LKNTYIYIKLMQTFRRQIQEKKVILFVIKGHSMYSCLKFKMFFKYSKERFKNFNFKLNPHSSWTITKEEK
jgi:hypothetical protein